MDQYKGKPPLWDSSLTHQSNTLSTNLLEGPLHASSQYSTAALADSETECRGEGAGKILCQQLSESGTHTPECYDCECARGKKKKCEYVNAVQVTFQDGHPSNTKYEARQWVAQQ